ncbi:MAG: lysine--tRNA ligase [Bacteriovoracaceae bacterium]|nr:lysine--tRNA ligase [Bacteriovoracaceae bacterium]
MKDKFIKQWTDLYSEQMNVRLEKRDKMLEAGSNPYKSGYAPDTTATKLKEKYEHLSKEEIGTTPDFKFAGRVLLVRDFGKAAFLQCDDGTDRFQLYIKKGVVSDKGFEEYKKLDHGDIIYASGDIFKTNKGELSLNAKEFLILTKALRPLPEKFHGLTDPELRYRMRYLDLIMNPETRDKLKKRSKIIRFIREFFYQNDFLEVETPMLHSIAGGATAKPFLTHHNALDMELFMRIAPELHLKRLLVGGFPKVFEMNRCFRNEGISYKHNPEFTSIEFYWAYATYENVMDITEELLTKLVKEVNGSNKVVFEDKEIIFNERFNRMTLKDSVKKFTDFSDADLKDKKKMIAHLLTKTEVKKSELEKMSTERLMVVMFEEFVEPNLIQPTFITQYPTEVSPLSRQNDNDPNYVDRFELFINGWEIANAFSELNNPTDQLSRFSQQAELKAGGDEEACDVDYDYVRALEYGMPPAGGWGMGIDRLCMILTNSPTIREIILFPQLKKELFFEGESSESKET